MTRSAHSGRVLRDGAVQRALGDPLRAPLATVLDSELEEAKVPELWHRIDARLAQPARPRVRRALGVTIVAAAAILLLLVGGRWLLRTPADTALALVDGGAPRALNAAAARAAFAFADGSRVEVTPFTELHAVRNDARTFVTSLERGSALFEVRPGGARRWVIEAGPATVEVLGTRFTVQRDAAAVRVEVDRGLVLVRSPTFAGGSTRLTAGQSVVVTAPVDASSGAPATAVSARQLPPPVSVSPPHAPSAATPEATVGLAQTRGTLRLEQPVPAGKPNTEASLDPVERELLAADAARRRADRVEAVRALESALALAAPGDKRRGLAALSLARLVLANDPQRAAAVLREAFGAMPAGLVEDALARRVEAEGRAGHLAEASRLAAEYWTRFPSGQRLHEVTRWSGD